MDSSVTFLRMNEMVPCSPECFQVFGGLKGYIKHLASIIDEEFVVMLYNGYFYCVPSKYAYRVFIQGGVFVNE